MTDKASGNKPCPPVSIYIRCAYAAEKRSKQMKYGKKQTAHP